MILNPDQMEDVSLNNRNGLIPTKYRWVNKTIPYKLSAGHTKEQNKLIELALQTLQSVSCLKFVRYTNETDYVKLDVNGSL